MKIIKQGDPNKDKRLPNGSYTIIFNCFNCDCRFEYDSREDDFEKDVSYTRSRGSNIWHYHAFCPCCKKQVTEEVIEPTRRGYGRPD